MTYMQAIKCNACSQTSECHPDDGPPIGWYLLAKMGPTHNGSWEEEEERHFCSIQCVASGTQQLV